MHPPLRLKIIWIPLLQKIAFQPHNLLKIFVSALDPSKNYNQPPHPWKLWLSSYFDPNYYIYYLEVNFQQTRADIEEEIEMWEDDQAFHFDEAMGIHYGWLSANHYEECRLRMDDGT